MKIRDQGSNAGGRRGIALLYAVLGSFTAASMVTLLLGISLSSDKDAKTRRVESQAQYLADGGVEMAKKQIQNALANFASIPSGGTVTIDGNEVLYTVRATGFTDTTSDSAGIQTLVNGYEVRAEARVGNTTAQSYRMVQSLATPLFQFAVFYTSDLEINPGPSMTLRGRVHSNANMYLGTGNTLTMNTNYVRAVGTIQRNRKDDPSASTGTVRIRQWVENPFDNSIAATYTQMHSKSQLQALGPASVGGYDSNFTAGYDRNGNGSFYDAGDFLPFSSGALDLWNQPDTYLGGAGNTVMAGEHGVRESVVPESGSVKMYEEAAGGSHVFDPLTRQYVAAASPGSGTHNPGFYHDKADLKVIVATNGTWKTYDGNDNDITAPLSVANVVKISDIYDARQAGSSSTRTKTIDINLKKLKATAHWPANGLLYAAHYGEGTGTNAKGVRLVEGGVLKGPLTVSSEAPIYIQGDYNVGDASNPKVGASVIGDAVNLLSNSWDNTKAKGGTVPTASNTTYNVAIVTGNQDSRVGAYNGGLENLPRFHEKWDGKTCTIKGSFVNAWRSQYGTGAWTAATYSAPNRDWTYDPAFNNVANLPPFTPMAVSARDIVSW